MTRHPLLLAVFATDILTLLLLAGAAAVAFRIVLHWDPQDTGAHQLRLQAHAETAALAGAWAFGLHLFATASLIYAITNTLPDMVPGAMCGTGVLQAMRSGGPRMLIFRLVGLAILWVWWRMEKVNRDLPESPLAVVNARLVLLALPVLVLAEHAAWQAALAMEFQQPVNCCAIIYDRFSSLDDARQTMGVHNPLWMNAFSIATIGLLIAAIKAWKTCARRTSTVLLAVLTMVWLPLSAIALVRVLAAYHYGVLHHHCPWCLFLPEHRLPGFPIWAAWMLVALEAASALALSLFATDPSSPLGRTAGRKAAGAARNTVLAAMLFVLTTVGPALWWRLHFGVWLTG